MPRSGEPDPVAAAFEAEWSRVVATLIRRTGDWDLAEECAQEAFAEAARRWPASGVPDNPGAWLTTVAGNRAIDRLRRARRGAELIEQAGREARVDAGEDDGVATGVDHDSAVADDRLRLIFTCCHPALPVEGRVALTLRLLGGLSVAEIARAFLVTEPAMAKRLVRAKAKIGAAGIPYRVPPDHLLGERLGGVLAVIYLMFNEGYAASGGDAFVRAPLCAEAIRLGRLLTRLMPDEPEASGLLALMLLHDARRAARVDAAGELVTLEEQDRTLWDGAVIAEATALLEAALRRREAGPYQLQAAIVAVHAAAPTAAATDWTEIVALYDALLTVLPTPVVRLNRAIAVGLGGDVDAALASLDELDAVSALDGYHLLPAARADLLRRAGRFAEAEVAYGAALAMVADGPEQRYLARRKQEVCLGTG